MSKEIESNTVRYGRNADNEVKYYRCPRCNFPIKEDRHVSSPSGSRAGTGNFLPNTQLNGSLSAGATTVTVDSTADFASSGYIYIYDSGGAYSSSCTMNKVAYTGKTGTTFTGCTGVTAHNDNTIVRGEETISGCPQCGTFLWKE